MRRLLTLAALLALPALAHAGGNLSPISRNAAIFAPTPAGGGGGATLAVENLSNAISSGTVTTSSVTLVTTANTTRVAAVFAYRRNSSQSIQAVLFNGSPMTEQATTSAAAMRTSIWTIDSPGAGTFLVNVTLSASSPGFSFRALSFTGTTTSVTDTQTAIGSVTTSTLTFTTNSGDLVLTGMCKQDASTSEPTLNSSDSTIWYDTDFNSGGAGNGGHFKIAVSSATAASKTVNYSWTSAANHSFAGIGLR